MINKSTELQKILGPISKELLKVKSELKRQINKISKSQIKVDKIIKYFFKAPGKWLRPALAILSARACNPEFSKHGSNLIKLAIIAECIHSASLIHDDIIDEAEYRRNQKSLSSKFGNKIAVLTGDVVYTYALTLLTDNFEKKIVTIFINCIKKMCQSEIFNLTKTISSYNDYLSVISDKTAELMSVSCQSGAILTNSSKNKIEALRKYGLHFGIAYQLVDDYEDNEVPRTLDSNNIEKAKEYIKQAKDNIKTLNTSEYKSSLENLADFVILKSENNEK